jgi:predicted Zn-dependent protease
MKKPVIISIISVFISIVIIQCEKEKSGLISKNQEIQFGGQLDSLVTNSPEDYNIINENEYSNAYSYMYNMMNKILESDYLNRKEYFEWTIRIIDEDVLNAFAAPGGYMYFYTGLMQYLDNEAQLAGVMAHEIAHVDRRHSAQQLERELALTVIISIILGKNPSQLEEYATALAKGLSNLAFSRNHEYEADEFAVKYTSDTDYNPRGISGFFTKMEEIKTVRYPEFLSTHPDPGNRLEAIDEVWKEIGSPDGHDNENEYAIFLGYLP